MHNGVPLDAPTRARMALSFQIAQERACGNQRAHALQNMYVEQANANSILECLANGARADRAVLVTSCAPTFTVLWASAKAQEVIGLRASWLIGRHVREIIYPNEMGRQILLGALATRRCTGTFTLLSGATVSVTTTPLVSLDVPAMHTLCQSHVEWVFESINVAPGTLRRSGVERSTEATAEEAKLRHALVSRSVRTAASMSLPAAPRALLSDELRVQDVALLTASHLLAYVNMSSEALIVTDASKRVVLVNLPWTELCGFAMHEVQGRDCAEFLQCEDTDLPVARAFSSTLSSGRPAGMIVVNRRADGRKFLNRVEGYPFFGALDPTLVSENEVVAPRIGSFMPVSGIVPPAHGEDGALSQGTCNDSCTSSEATRSDTDSAGSSDEGQHAAPIAGGEDRGPAGVVGRRTLQPVLFVAKLVRLSFYDGREGGELAAVQGRPIAAGAHERHQ